MHDLSSVNVQCLTGDIPGVSAGEEDRHGAKFLWMCGIARSIKRCFIVCYFQIKAHKFQISQTCHHADDGRQAKEIVETYCGSDG